MRRRILLAFTVGKLTGGRHLRSAVAPASLRLKFERAEDGTAWLEGMSRRLTPYMPSKEAREVLLVTVPCEATRAGVDPQLILGPFFSLVL